MVPSGVHWPPQQSALPAQLSAHPLQLLFVPITVQMPLQQVSPLQPQSALAPLPQTWAAGQQLPLTQVPPGHAGPVTAEQIPGVGPSQRKQGSVQASLQHTPSTQSPETQSPGPSQAAPLS